MKVSDEKFKQLKATIEKGGFPPITGMSLTKEQAVEIKKLLDLADEISAKYYKYCIETRVIY